MFRQTCLKITLLAEPQFDIITPLKQSNILKTPRPRCWHSSGSQPTDVLLSCLCTLNWDGRHLFWHFKQNYTPALKECLFTTASTWTLFSKAVTKSLKVSLLTKHNITAHDSLSSDKFLKAIHMGNSLWNAQISISHRKHFNKHMLKILCILERL